MATNYVLSLQPTFTQGLVLGQLSIIILLYLVLKYLFLDSTEYPFETSSYHPHVDGNISLQNKIPPSMLSHEQHESGNSESAEWLNLLIRQLLNVYRSRLRNHLSGPEGDEVARKRVEDYANRVRPVSFMDYINVHAVDLGSSSPQLLNGRRVRKFDSSAPVGTEFNVHYVDTVSVSLSTSYLFNYPMPSFARLPVSLTISLSLFKSQISIIPPSPTSIPALTISLSPEFTLDLSTTSLMGSRAKLANVPKLHELIQHQVRRVLANRGPWTIPLPVLTSVPEMKQEIKQEIKEELGIGLQQTFV